jgi:hypothetical protein
MTNDIRINSVKLNLLNQDLIILLFFNNFNLIKVVTKPFIIKLSGNQLPLIPVLESKYPFIG